MSTHLAKLFTQDDRAVAPIIGIILLFGIFFIGFAGYQAEYVPQQNAETEFQHYQDVQNDLIVVRNAISRAGQQNQPQFESVRLGTTYRERILAINPPAPVGTLQTTRSYEIKVQRSDGTQVVPTIPTRFLEYQNQYNELDIDLIRYENSVLYLTDAGQRESVVLEEQNLVRNDTVVITALQKPFSESSIGRATVELYPTQANSQELPSGDLNVTLPTRLSASYWNTALSEYNWLEFTVFNDETYPGDVQVLEIKVDSDKIELNTVGISEPTEDSAKLNTGTDTSDTPDQTQASQVENVTGSTPDKEKKTLEFDITNTGNSPVEITDFNISTMDVAYIERSQNRDEVEINGGSANAGGESVDSNYATDGTTYSLNDTATLGSDATERVIMGKFDEGGGTKLKYNLISDSSESELTVTLRFSDDSAQEYYFDVTNVNS